jgi:hypothetical protein
LVEITFTQESQSMAHKNTREMAHPAPAQILPILDIVLRIFSLLELLVRLIGYFKPSPSAEG